MSKGNFDTRVLAEVAIGVALATVLSMIKTSLPYGGSITLGSMVPILLIAFRRGTKIGVFTGIVYGFVQMFIDGWWYQPLGMILDYPLAFGVIGLAGVFKKQPIVGVVFALLLRYIAHVISGVMFFYMYAPEGVSPLIYSITYNATYMIPEIISSAILIYLLVQRNVLDMNL